MNDQPGTSSSYYTGVSSSSLDLTRKSCQEHVSEKLRQKNDLLNAELIKYQDEVAAHKVEYKNRLDGQYQSYKEYLQKKGYSQNSANPWSLTGKLKDYQEKQAAVSVLYYKQCDEKVKIRQICFLEELNGYQKALNNELMQNIASGSDTSLDDMLMDEAAVETAVMEIRPHLNEEVVQVQKKLLRVLAERDRLVEKKKRERVQNYRPHQPRKIMSMVRIATEMAKIAKEDINENTGEVADYITKIDEAAAWMLDLHQKVIYNTAGLDRNDCIQLYLDIDDIDGSKIVEINAIADRLMQRDVGAGVKRRRDNINRRWEGLQMTLHQYRQRLLAVIEGRFQANRGGIWAGAGEGN